MNLTTCLLKDYANIVEGNALRMDWGRLLTADAGRREWHKSDVSSPKSFSYIMGNPPFVGASMMTAEQTAQTILDARAKYSDVSLADLYDPLTMPADLRAAHAANDRAVLAAYGLAPDTPEPEIVAHLFKLYAEMVKKEKESRK